MCASPKNGSAWCSQRHWNAIGPSMIWLDERVGAAVALGREGGQQLRVAVVAGGRVVQRAQEPLRRLARARACRGPSRTRRRSPPIVARYRAQSAGAICRAASSNQQVRASGAAWLAAAVASSITLSSSSLTRARVSSGVPFASVITPTRGRPELERTLAKPAAQELADWEAVVVDDGDGEGVELPRGVRRRADRARARPRAGAGRRAQRRRSTCARGDLVCWLDDDDWWEDPAHLSLLRAGPRAGPIASASAAAGSFATTAPARCSTSTRPPGRCARTTPS